ncbi:hypothetical protein [Polyangium fumosum]|uniref:hypothetical protein n=1 Tax=Polyangium fumosum TaxID=889272 RepID=UPI001478B1D6|nr:hypothetical protein [Polyangium fumosum]
MVERGDDVIARVVELGIDSVDRASSIIPEVRRGSRKRHEHPAEGTVEEVEQGLLLAPRHASAPQPGGIGRAAGLGGCSEKRVNEID